MKKIILIIFSAILLLGIAYYYFFWQNQPLPPTTLTEDPNPSSFFPGGTDKSTTTNPFTGTNSDQVVTNNQDPFGSLPTVKGFSQLTSAPIGGAGSILSSSSTIYYIDKASGNVYKVVDPKKTPVRMSNTTIPRVFDSFWGEGKTGLNIVLRSFNKDGELDIFSGNIKYGTTTASSTSDTLSELTGSHLTREITDLAVSPNKNQLFYLEKDPAGVIGYTTDFSLTKKTQVFKSPVSEWLSQWVSGDIVALQTKAAAGVLGYLYFLDLKTRNLTNIISDVSGLTTLVSPNAKKVLLSQSNRSADLTLSVYSLADLPNKELLLKTLPEKCTWSKDNITIYCGVPNQLLTGIYPDNWYSGEINFSDTIWKINTVSGTSTVLINPELENLKQPIDSYQPFLSPNEKYLYLTNKQDLTLWALDLTQEF